MVIDHLYNMLPSVEIFTNYSANQNSSTRIRTMFLNIISIFYLVKVNFLSFYNGKVSESKVQMYKVKAKRNNPYKCECILQDCTQAPLWEQEPFITDGYLPQGKCLRFYLRVFYTYNYELMNVWTNVVPLIFFVYLLHGFNQELNLHNKWPLLVINAGSVVIMLFSAIAHTFHSRSERWHRNCFLLDYFGIVIYSFCSTIANWFACSSLEHYNYFCGSMNMKILLFNSVFGFLLLSLTKIEVSFFETVSMQRWLKCVPTAIGYLYGMSPVFYRMYSGNINSTSLFYHMLQLLFMVLNPILFASDFPQKFWPGKHNVFFHSHQLFHISAALSCYFNTLAVYSDIVLKDGMWNDLKIQPDYPNFNDVTNVIYWLLTSCTTTIVLVNVRLIYNIRRKKEKVK